MSGRLAQKNRGGDRGVGCGAALQAWLLWLRGLWRDDGRSAVVSRVT